MNNIDLKFRKASVSYTKDLVKKYGSEKASQYLSDAIQSLASYGEGISNTYKILFYSLCLKHIREN